MFDVFGPLFLIGLFSIGMIIGATIFPVKWLKFTSIMQCVGIALLLFSMGVSMGGSPTFLQDLRDAGVQALVYAVATIMGSVLLVWIFSRLVFRKDSEK